jgi:CRP/FNR family transcriptional regulator, cyclic AMP receptor protein
MDVAPLAQVALFQGLSQPQLKKVASICEPVTVEKGALIFREGEAAQSMYVLVTGKVRISRRVPGMGEEALAILDAGQYFGEMGVVEESARSADAYAHETATLWRIDRGKFDQLLFTDKDLAYAVLWTLVRTLSGRLRETNEKMKAFFAMSKF